LPTSFDTVPDVTTRDPAERDIVVRVDGLGKRYRIGRRDSYRTLRETLTDAFASPVQAAMRAFDTSVRSNSNDDGSIWALRDVSFGVRRGEVVGVIGRNGSGKSTLLKILSRITEPTEGGADIHGRVASLLEVGTGFHPELTGRENLWLNGALLGMSRAEIERKFDEIVDFAGVRAFIDTPVKHYSSGMQVRLAFAIAAHLEPEILIVDEVLAVGDVVFQRKCLGKMKAVSVSGRTVLFVSHDMPAVRALCTRAILLDAGRVVLDASTDEVVTRYLGEQTIDRPVVSAEEIALRVEGVVRRDRPTVRFREIAIQDEHGAARGSFDSDETIFVVVVFECFELVANLRILVQVVDENGAPLLSSQNLDDHHLASDHRTLAPGVYRTICAFSKHLFGARRFLLDVHLEHLKIEHLVARKIVGFEVRFKGFNDLTYGPATSAWFRPQCEWRLECLEASR
jgi:homopolymeric O-antigen transport system ATP-binding protein